MRRPVSHLIDRWLLIWWSLDGPEPQPEYEFNKPLTKHRFDFAWPDVKVAVEVEGGIFTSKEVGAHVRGVRYSEDCRKYNRAQILGWRVFRFTTLMIDDLTQYEAVLEYLYKLYDER
jgi:very-short-patch-repair endonuclease